MKGYESPDSVQEVTSLDIEHPVDTSEHARALGEANCERWLPGFMRWAAPRLHDLEILLRAANMDGFRAGLKATLPKSEAELAEERRMKWRADRIAKTAEQDARLQAADIAQELGSGSLLALSVRPRSNGAQPTLPLISQPTKETP